MKSALSLRSSQRGFYNGYLQRINCDMPCQRPASEKIQVSVVSLGSREIQWDNSLVIECFFSLFFWPLNPFNHVFGLKVFVSNWQLSEATVIIVRIQGRHTFFYYFHAYWIWVQAFSPVMISLQTQSSFLCLLVCNVNWNLNPPPLPWNAQVRRLYLPLSTPLPAR